MEIDELKYWIAFNRVPHVGRARFILLERHFGTLKEAWSAGSSALESAGIDARTVKSILSSRPKIDPDGEIEALNRAGVRAKTWHDSDYPARLKEGD